jgi:hypothetical protein
MSDTKTIEVNQFVAAPSGRVFAFLTDPRQHVVIDGSGTVKGAESGPITEVGQVFVMSMHRDDLGHYRSVNTVTEFEPGTTLGWAPNLDRSYQCKVVEMVAAMNMTTGGHTTPTVCARSTAVLRSPRPTTGQGSRIPSSKRSARSLAVRTLPTLSPISLAQSKARRSDWHEHRPTGYSRNATAVKV